MFMDLKLSRENIWLVLLSFTLCTFAFSERLNSWGVILLGAFFLIDPKLFSKLKLRKFSFKLLPLLGFFSLYLVFFLFSDMKAAAGHALFSKFTFFLLPLIFFYENYFSPKNEKALLIIFSLALSCGFLYELSASLNAYYFSAETPSMMLALNRMNVSAAIMHPGYYSAYFMFGVIWHYFNKSQYRLFFIALFTVALVLLLSRIVLGLYAIFGVHIAINHIRKSSKPLATALMVGLLGIAIGALMYQIPMVGSRINETLTKFNNTSKSVDISSATDSRRITYAEEINLISKKPILGYGLGNSKPVLRAHLIETGYAELGKDMNNHNQYFKTWMELGIVGIVGIFFLLGFLFYYFRINKLKVAFWFTAMVSFGLLTDDLFEIQAGIVFFAIIWSLYLNQREEISYP